MAFNGHSWLIQSVFQAVVGFRGGFPSWWEGYSCNSVLCSHIHHSDMLNQHSRAPRGLTHTGRTHLSTGHVNTITWTIADLDGSIQQLEQFINFLQLGIFLVVFIALFWLVWLSIVIYRPSVQVNACVWLVSTGHLTPRCGTHIGHQSWVGNEMSQNLALIWRSMQTHTKTYIWPHHGTVLSLLCLHLHTEYDLSVILCS